MIVFHATILKFAKKGEKTGWNYIEISADIAGRLSPGNKKSFRVKGKLDNFSFKQAALLPMGGGTFILPFNASMRKGTGKRNGSSLKVQMETDKSEFVFNHDFITCLEDEPSAIEHFKKLPGSHQRYFSKWIDSAKTESTKAKRIAMAVNALTRGRGYAEMIRENAKEKLPRP